MAAVGPKNRVASRHHPWSCRHARPPFSLLRHWELLPPFIQMLRPFWSVPPPYSTPHPTPLPWSPQHFHSLAHPSISVLSWLMHERKLLSLQKVLLIAQSTCRFPLGTTRCQCLPCKFYMQTLYVLCVILVVIQQRSRSQSVNGITIMHRSWFYRFPF